MPTFTDPRTDAAEASEALRGLAHASRTFDDPADTYQVIGDLTAATRSLPQILDQLATAHLTNQHRARDDAGDSIAGGLAVVRTAEALRHASALVDEASDALDKAHQQSGRIAWHTGPATELIPEDAPEVARRWVGVVFLQGEEADRVLDVIERDGPRAGLNQLTGYDYGTETTQAALENGDVHDRPPSAMSDNAITDGDYALNWNSFFGHVALYRQTDLPHDPALDEPAVVAPVPAGISGISAHTPTRPHSRPIEQPTRRLPNASWFGRSADPAAGGSRGLSL
ncbi:hypothetical protein [Humibacter ginsenosidimutans]|uniref:Uncharacterized protein n=1 Tax=Humibacter ginsenosidimutans TaxID=2599293 RepID=A0A5B8M397_9MICO|nr:hypothetical protein [Humibacter ginsenosidimutans]QDZ14202.1 hypothetical protein FPZ11_04935 [Humibacter ginsenosidimutans]